MANNVDPDEMAHLSGSTLFAKLSVLVTCDLRVKVSASSPFMSLYSRLTLSQIPRDSLKYFEISVPRHIRFAELRKK